jgi:monofunctional biosynthetic peptidoglycan transglycosylase
MGHRKSNRSPGLLARLRRCLWWTLLIWIALTLLPVLGLRWVPPPTSAFMLEKRLAGVLRGNPPKIIRYDWTEWNAIAPPMRLAVVAAEDQKFPRHWGFDFESIADALDHPGKRGRLRGASTISQQVARNLFLWQGRSFLRKGLEAYFTVLLEACWPKRRILEVYLNVAEFGEGVYGVAAASQAFFGRRPAGLSMEESALLAAVLPSPTRLYARSPSPYVRERAVWIEAQMTLLGGPAYLRDL